MSSYLIEVHTDQGITRFATSQINVTYDGYTWAGGKIEKVGNRKQAASLDSNTNRLTFSGVDQTVISLFSEDWRNRQCKVFRATIDQSWQVSNVAEYIVGDMVGLSYDLGADKSKVVLTIKSLYGAINQSNSPDLGLLFNTDIGNDKTIYFGKTGPVTGSRGGKPGGQIDFDIIEVP